MGDHKTPVALKGRVYRFSISTIEFIEEVSAKRIFFSVFDQLLRSSTSVGANLVEAKSASSKRDFIKYYQIALKSANETKYWLYLIRDAIKPKSEKLPILIKEIDEISKIIAACVISLKKNNEQQKPGV